MPVRPVPTPTGDHPHQTATYQHLHHIVRHSRHANLDANPHFAAFRQSASPQRANGSPRRPLGNGPEWYRYKKGKKKHVQG